MDNKLQNDERKISEFPICQFNIVLGEHDKIFRNSRKNKYFYVIGNEDLKLVQYAVHSEYKKKKKEGFAVASEIYFLIPDESYRDLAIDLMDKLNFNGSVKVVPSEKKEEVTDVEEPVEEKLSEIKEDVSDEVVPVSVEEDNTLKEEEKKIDEKVDTFEVKKVSSTKSYSVSDEMIKDTKEKIEPPVDMVFHGDFERPYSAVSSTKRSKRVEKKIKDDDVSSYMWGESEEKELLSKKKKIDLPVIIFIISFLFLIGAVVLLFILK